MPGREPARRSDSRRGGIDEAGGAVRVSLTGEAPEGFLSAGLIDRLLPVVASDTAATAVVVEGGGGTFCLGLDPGSLVEDGEVPVRQRAHAALERFATLLRAVDRVPCPVIAVVDGAAAGGGVALAAAADIVIASRQATFGLPETLLGLVPALAFPVLARRIGMRRARWMAMTGSTVDAGEALRLGLADVLADDAEAAVARCLGRLSRLDRRSVAAVKRLATRYDDDPRGYQDAALQAFGDLVESPDSQARLRRFASGLAPWAEGDDT